MAPDPDPEADQDIRFLDLAKVCPEVEDMMYLADHMPFLPCPNPLCFDGVMPDPDEETLWEPVNGIPGLYHQRLIAVPCAVCFGAGIVFDFCLN